MKNYLALLVAFAFLGCFSSTNKTSREQSEQKSDRKKLPIPGKEFLANNSAGIETDITYLETYFKKIGQRQYEKDALLGDSVNWSQKFEGGISIICKGVDSGINYRITLPNYDRGEIIKFIKWFYETAENSWNKDSTAYSPTEGDAGCYYQIKKDSFDQFVIDYYCGC